ESYPLYSSFLSPSSMTPTTCLSPTYPTIPHILFVTSLFFPITPIENLEPEVRGLNPGPANLSIRSGIRHRKLAVSTVTSSNTSNPKARCFYCHFIKYFEPESSGGQGTAAPTGNLFESFLYDCRNSNCQRIRWNIIGHDGAGPRN